MSTPTTDEIGARIIQELNRITGRALPPKIIRKEKKFPQFRCNIGALRMGKGSNPNVILQAWDLDEITPTYNEERKSFLFEYDETQILLDALKGTVSAPAWGHKEPASNGQSILIESSSPNIAKPFHMGHLRSTILGNFLTNLYRSQGYNVVSMNYLGDWGKQYGLLAVAWERWGDEEKLLSDPIRHLYELYVRVNKEVTIEQDWDPHAPSETDNVAKQYFASMESGDAEKLALWKRFRDLSLESLSKTYARLGIRYDVYSGESRAAKDPESQEVVQALMRSGVVSGARGGALAVQFDNVADPHDRKLQPAPLRKTDGATLYLTRDLGEIFWRSQSYPSDRYLYVVGEGQSLHFRQLKATVHILDPSLADRCEHIGFGLVKGMASRKGSAVFLSDVLDEAKARMLKKMQENPDKYQNVENPEETADVLGQSAVIIQDLLGGRLRNYDFDWDKSCASRGLTGPYLQYAHARICNIFKKVADLCDLDGECPPGSNDMLENTDMWKGNEWRPLVRVIAEYPKAIDACLRSREANPLVDMLMHLAKEIAEAYRDLSVKSFLDSDDADSREVGLRNALLFWCARKVLSSGMKLLGLRPISAM